MKIALIGAIAVILAAILGGVFQGSDLFNRTPKDVPPVLISFEPDKASPQSIETKINLTASVKDPQDDIVYYSFYLKGPSTNETWEVVQDWRTQNWWLWTPTKPGNYTIEVKASDGKNNQTDGLYDSRDVEYSIIELKYPVDAEGWKDRGLALRNQGRYEESLAAYYEALKLDPSDADTWNKKSYSLFALNRHEEALECASRAAELDPSMDGAWNNKGVSLIELGRYNEALEALDQSIKLNPSSAPAWANKGFALQNLKRYDESLTCYNKSLELDPVAARTYELKGEALNELERFNESLECHTRATELDPSYALSWANKAKVLHNLGRYSEAIEAFDIALQIDPSDSSYFNGRELSRKALEEQKLRQNNTV